MQQTLDEMGRVAFPVRPGETFHMTVSYSDFLVAYGKNTANNSLT